jgi:hypothetical protein
MLANASSKLLLACLLDIKLVSEELQCYGKVRGGVGAGKGQQQYY